MSLKLIYDSQVSNLPGSVLTPLTRNIAVTRHLRWKRYNSWWYRQVRLHVRLGVGSSNKFTIYILILLNASGSRGLSQCRAWAVTHFGPRLPKGQSLSFQKPKIRPNRAVTSLARPRPELIDTNPWHSRITRSRNFYNYTVLITIMMLQLEF